MVKNVLSFGKIYWFLAALFYFYQYTLRVSTGIMVDDLMRDFTITASTVGTIMGVSSLTYVIMQIPAGSLTDYFGVRRLLALAVLACAGGACLFSQAPSLWVLFAARILLGIGSAFAFICATKVISLYFPQNRMPFWVSLTIFIGSLGGVIGNGPLAHSVSYQGWRPTIAWISFFGLILAAAIFLMSLAKRDQSKTASNEPKGSLWQGVSFCLTSPPILLIAAWGFCIYMPICVFADSWGVLYIMKSCTIDRTVAAGHVSHIYVGILAGSLFYGWLATLYKNYRVIFMTSTTVLFCLFYLVLWQPLLSMPYLNPIFLMIGFLLSVQLLMFPAATQYAPNHMTASVVGVVNTTTMVSGAIFQKVVGLMADHLWDGAFCEGVPVYQSHCYRIPLSIILMMMALGTVLAFFIRKPKKNFV